MELKDLFKLAKKHTNLLLVYATLGGIAGILIYCVPSKYIATGSFYIGRTTDNSSNFFTYEGYYSQQTALTYANTVAALLESVDIQSKALSQLNIPVNENTLAKYARFINVKKSGPQLVTLAVKGNTYDTSKNLWMSLSDQLITTSQTINLTADNRLMISKVSSEPVVKPAYKSLWINVPAGIILGAALGLLVMSLKEYD